MSSSREESPDWVRSFQAPTQSVLTLSSGSESPLDDDPMSDGEDEIKLSKLFKKDPEIGCDQDGRSPVPQKTSKVKSQNENHNVKRTPGRKRKRLDLPSESEEKKDDKRSVKIKASEKSKAQELDRSVWELSSDSDTCAVISPERENHDQEAYDKVLHVKEEEGKQLEKGSKSKNEEKENNLVIEEKDGEIDVREDDITEKHGPQASSSRLPLVLSEKVQRSKALVECEGDSIDLSGDVGAVGRVVISDSPSGDHDMFLDLKGTIYKTAIIPSRTFCVVSFGPSEAKIEAIMNDFIQLKPQSNVYEAETMVEGTLDGFSFDSGDEAENQPTAMGQNGKEEAGEEQPKGKGKAEKTKGSAGKKAKAGGGKQPKKPKKKLQFHKKSKTKK